jgi:hypothetical protein
MTSSTHIDALLGNLDRTIARLSGERASKIDVSLFPRLSACAVDVASRFGAAIAPPAPPQQQRINAFAKLRTRPQQMSGRDWRLISWGLADQCGSKGRAFDDEEIFARIMEKFEDLLAAGQLTRKMWFGLASSYFSHFPENDIDKSSWLKVRTLVLKGFVWFQRNQRSEKKWINVVGRNLDVFSESPGSHLGQAMFAGQAIELEDFQACLQVPSESWFWKSVVDVQLKRVSALSDSVFSEKVGGMLQLGARFPSAADVVLAGLLQRYESGSMRDLPHSGLKVAALERWGSPQIGSSKSRWSVNVDDRVSQMVMRWFAKEDLETFFKLLQGEREVDQDRLDYWLRFVGQIRYTRIVLGSQAMEDRSSDFVEFRKKNADRISMLRGGSGDDNAFIMNIKGYVIVEFSRKGNACFVRKEAALPFKPGQKVFDLNYELKDKKSVLKRLLHTHGRWQSEYDQWLASEGIYPDEGHAKKTSKSAPRKPVTAVRAATPTGIAPRPIGLPDASPAVDAAIKAALRYATANFVRYTTSDQREKSGAYWFELPRSHPPMERKLEALGFKFKPGRGYWIK